MTRQLPASHFRGRNGPPLQDRPRAGTKLGEVYDALRRGERVHLGGNYTRELTDFWGMEIRSKRGIYGYSELIGEWEGEVFVPLERILQEDQVAPAGRAA